MKAIEWKMSAVIMQPLMMSGDTFMSLRTASRTPKMCADQVILELLVFRWFLAFLQSAFLTTDHKAMGAPMDEQPANDDEGRGVLRIAFI